MNSPIHAPSSWHLSQRLITLLAFIVISCLSLTNTRGDEPRGRENEVVVRGKIVLFGVQLEKNKGSSIVTVNPDGTGLETLYTISENQGVILTGRVSPDARSFAFTVIDQSAMKNQVWLMGTNGERRKVLDDGLVRAWSPDGNKLACIGGEYGKWKSFVLDLATKETQPLSIPEVDHVDDWSPDGKYFSVMLGRPEKHAILRGSESYPLRQVGLLPTRGDGRQTITSSPAFDNLWVRFSPDGTRVSSYQREYQNDRPHELSMVRNRDGSNALVILNYDRLDGNLRKHPDGPSYWNPEAAACWSPDGKTLACLVSNEKLRAAHPEREEKSRFALIFASSTGRIERLVDLKAMGLASKPAEVDWASDAK
jgi:hypothetical protein